MPDTVTAPKVNEGAPAKARRYLIEGRLTVTRVDGRLVEATCRGDGEVYKMYFSREGWQWFCTCPARSDQCAHLRALRLVVDRPA